MAAETLLALLTKAARERPDAPAIGAPGRRPAGWAELAAHARKTANAFGALGLTRTDRVVIALPDGAEAAIAVLETACASVAVPIPAGTPEAEAAGLLTRLGARAILVARQAPAPAAAAARSQGRLVIAVETRPDAPAGLFDFAVPLPPLATEGSGPSEHDVAVILHTSGTTSDARRVAYSHAQLCRVGREGAEFLQLGPEDRGLNFAPTFHLAGLYYAVVYPLATQSPVFVAPTLDPRRFVEWFAEARPTFFGGSPTAHQAICDAAAGHETTLRSSSLRFVRSAAASLSPALQDRIEATFGVPVLDGYALSESGLIASAGLEPRSRKRGTVGRSFMGAEIRIVDEAGAERPVAVAGEITVRSPRVMREYEGDAAATREAFFGDWLRTGDEGFLDAEGFLTITGRLRERINRGGEKVSPREVDEALLAHPDVAEAAAFGVPHPRLGEDLAAVVVARQGARLEPAALRTFVAERLAPFKVPSRIVLRDRIPRGPTGKIPRHRLVSLLGTRPAPATEERLAPEASLDVAGIVALELARVLDRPGVGRDDDFFELGGDSLNASALMARLAEVLGTRLPPTALFEAPSARALAARIAGDAGAAWGPLVPFRVVGSGAPLFFVHAIGGGVLFFSKLAAHLEGRPFFGLQAPGFDGRDAPLSEVPQLAAHYVEAVAARQPRGPYRLGGFCMGAAVALEMARLFELRGEPVELLVLLDPPPLPLGSRRSVGDRARVALAAAWNRVRGLEPGPAISSREPAVVQANRRALRRYRPGRIRAPLALYFAGEGSRTPALEAEHALRRLTSGRVDVGTVSGGHKSLFEEPAIGELARQIEARLAALSG
jgi:acyl-CoA synthetase (AMP-forming)/AMP-acid ligase II/thioesterase domain-containing protein/acyl carrier protein